MRPEKEASGLAGAPIRRKTTMNTDSHANAETPKTFLSRLCEKMASLPVSRKKVLQYLGMFGVLTVIYYCYFVAGTKNSCPVVVITLPQLGVLFLKFLLFSGWPFAAMAFFDPTWRSRDAGNVFVASYVTVNVIWYYKTGCGFCIFAAWVEIIPCILCAWLAHGLGALRYRAQREE